MCIVCVMYNILACVNRDRSVSVKTIIIIVYGFRRGFVAASQSGVTSMDGPHCPKTAHLSATVEVYIVLIATFNLETGEVVDVVDLLAIGNVLSYRRLVKVIYEQTHHLN